MAIASGHDLAGPRPRQTKRSVPLADASLTDKALEIHRRLCPVYGCPIPYFHSLDPLSELVSSLLSHRTRNADSGRAFKALRARYPDWADLVDAPVEEIEATISGVTWPELKAPRIRAILAAVAERHGSLSLDFLKEMEVEAARSWLEAIPGVGPEDQRGGALVQPVADARLAGGQPPPPGGATHRPHRREGRCRPLASDPAGAASGGMERAGSL